MKLNKGVKILVLFFIILLGAISFQVCVDSEVSKEKLESYKSVQLTPLPVCECEIYQSDMIRYQEWYATSESMLPIMRPGEHFYSDYLFHSKNLRLGIS